MTSLVLGAVLAVLAAVLLNASYVLQHLGSVDGPRVDARTPLATLGWMVRTPLWAAGALAGLAGWALHIAAMRHAPLSLVQAFVAGGLALAAPMLAFALRRRLEPAEVRAVVVMVVALIMLSIGLHAPAGSRFTGWVLATWLFVQVVIAAGLAARRGALITSAAAGLLYGAADLSLKAVTRAGSLEAVVGSPWLWTALGATVAAFFAFQHALQRDRPLAVIAIMTAATNVTSIAGALVVFQEPLGHSPALQLLHAAAFALVVLAAWRLAPVNARLTDAPASG